jgi:hypothetical protein
MTPEQAAQEAITEINARGWCQYTTTDREGRVCIGGALNLAMTGKTALMSHVPWAATLAKIIDEQYPETQLYETPTDLVVNWNDDEDRTKDQIIAALEKLATETEWKWT